MAKRINGSIEPEYIWERQPNESIEAYEAFALYRSMGADEGKRSLSVVAQALNKSKTLLGRWSSTHNWQERVRAYDLYVEEIALGKATKARAKMRERQIKLAQKLQEIGFTALDNIAINDPHAALRMITEGMRIEDKQRAAEQAAHTPSAAETSENEALKRLDEVLKEIKSAF